MLKKYIYTFFFAISCILSLSTVCMENHATFNPSNTKFAFDFHGVVVTEPSALTHIIKNLDWDIIPECNRYVPYFLYKMMAFFYYWPPAEGFRNICVDCKQTGLENVITRITNSIIVIPDTISIMKELKTKGYDIDMASNIDNVSLKDLEENSQYQHIQDVLTLFTNKKIVDCSAINTINSTYKPNILYFRSYQREYNADQKNIIFVDDRHENIVASEKTGMIGIHFKNPKQLRDKLVEYGILD